MATINLPEAAKINDDPLPDIKSLPKPAPEKDYTLNRNAVVGFNEIRIVKTEDVGQILTTDLRGGIALAITSPKVVILGCLHPDVEMTLMENLMVQLLSTKAWFAEGPILYDLIAVFIGPSVKDENNRDVFAYPGLYEHWKTAMERAGYPTDYRKYPATETMSIALLYSSIHLSAIR